LDHLVRGCLAKEPDERWQSARDVVLQLKWIDEARAQAGSAESVAPEPRRNTPQRFLFAAGWATTLVLSIAVWVRWQTSVPAPLRKFTITPPGQFESPVISPDGEHIAYILHPDEGAKQVAEAGGVEPPGRLNIQDLDRERPREIEGADGADLPFWSPDSKFIAFGARNHIWKAAVQTGAPSPLCDIADEFLGGAWTPDGRSIIYSTYHHGIYEVSAGGGTPKLLVPENRSVFGNHIDTPKFLPHPSNGYNLIYATQQKNAAGHDIVLHSLDSGKGSLLVSAANRPVYSHTGHLLYVSMADSIQRLMALPFSAATMKATGDAFPLIQSGFSPLTIAISPSVSRNGTLAYKALERPPRQLVWRDRQNNAVTPIPTDLRSAGHVLIGAKHMSLSADGRSIAVDGYRNRGRDLWIIDLTHGTASSLPFSAESDVDPVWSPTGKEIAFRSNHHGYWEIYTRSADPGVNGAKLLVTGPLAKRPTDWSADGRFLLYDMEDPNTGVDIWYLKAKDTGGSESAPLLRTTASESGAKFSPNGRLFAYVSNKSGKAEVFIAPFPDGSPSRQVSVNSGNQPVWSRDGKQLFFLEGDTLVSVMISSRPTLSIGEIQRLFKSRYHADIIDLGYAVSPSGDRFLLGEPSGVVPRSFIRVVENWFAEFSAVTTVGR